MLEQVLLDGLPAGQEESPLSMMRSNTMEHILRETLSGGRELQDLLLEWDHSLPEEVGKLLLLQQCLESSCLYLPP